ncbi:MAG TPA: TonB-dependent receptor, partial [Rhizomicrobium sp.]|nr:TonB-dependent receptor [Rhizomicrobium sp.]
DTEIGKVTARYDITPQYAIRGTVSTGFRAPTLAEEFYTAVNVSPTNATLQLPADSAAAKLVGLENLKPESSTSFSLGVVTHPLEDLSATVDVYSIAIGNRIVNSGTVRATGNPGDIIAPAVVFPAIALAGVTLDPTATAAGVTAFLNGISTLTQGVDLTVNYPTDFGDMGLINWTLAGNYNTIHVGRTAPPPAVLLASNPNATFFSPFSVFGFEHQTPAFRVNLTADWTLDEWGATLRETLWGPRHGYTGPNNSENIPNNQASVGITDLEVRYSVTEGVQLAIGANNLFNMHADINGAAPDCANLPPGTIIQAGGTCTSGPNKSSGQVLTNSNGSVYQTPIGGFFDPNGGYYYARINYNF